MLKLRNPLFVAIDTADLDEAVRLAEMLKDVAGGLKLGLEFFTAFGPDGVARIAEFDLPLFIDLKFHDIPNTVSGAVRSLMRMRPAMFTVHAFGGLEMLRAAADTAALEADRLGLPRPWVLGVTVLTSLDAGDLDVLGVEGSTHKVVARLARLAEKAGLDGIVCAPDEISTARSTLGEKFRLVVPGIRPKGAEMHDQKRVTGPREAIQLGADVLVVGRPITRSDDPVFAARSILGALERAEGQEG
ncbi:MAG: orotidine-5'-phosphate decarboxylase [Alphaproteobacteria bacterium]|nr:MAG: orotidine-5'-phosphate decarboxylase [Alphaproteobacteria bacterium]